MCRIGYLLCCCVLLSLTVSCTSGAAKRVTAPPITKSESIAERMQSEQSSQIGWPENSIPETISAAQKAAQLFPELAQAVDTYDIHKALTLFNTIYDLCNGQEDQTILTDARSKIRPLLEIISIEPINQPASTNAGLPFIQPFTARVVITTPEKQFPLDNYPITVLYPSSGTGSSLKTAFVRTDSDGFLYFTPPPPEQACDGTLSFCLFPEGETADTANIPENLCLSFPYKVATTEKRIPTIIAILDYDETDAPIFSGNITATRLLSGLMKRGFSRIGLDEYRELAHADEASVIRAAQGKIGTAVDRLIFGKTYIMEEMKDEVTFTCTIKAYISIWDFKQARKINQFTFEHTAEAKTKAQAIVLARTGLGETVIAETLNYSL